MNPNRLTSNRLTTWLHLVLGLVLAPERRDERGLSQSTENAVLLAGAITIAGIVVTAVTVYVTAHMPK